MTLLSAFRIDVLETFKALKAALTALHSALDADANLPAWFLPPQELPVNTHANVRTQAYTLLRQLEYLDSQKPREVLVGAGLIAASENTLQAIAAVNDCKDRFKTAMLALKKANIKMNDIDLSAEFESLLEKRRDPFANETQRQALLDKRPESMANTLKKVGLGRLHLKQCYRRIPIFLERPSKVSWTWANTKAITRITTEHARQLLLKQGSDFNITQQLAKLQLISAQEPLAIVQELAPHLRANVVFCDDKSKVTLENNEQEKFTNHERRIMVKGPVPLFYLAKENDTFPNIRPPGLKRGKNKDRRIRSDVKLDPEPFLPSIRVHRYIKIE